MLGVDVLAEDVSTERANRPFLRFQFQFDAERFGAAGRRKPAGLRVSRARPRKPRDESCTTPAHRTGRCVTRVPEHGRRRSVALAAPIVTISCGPWGREPRRCASAAGFSFGRREYTRLLTCNHDATQEFTAGVLDEHSGNSIGSAVPAMGPHSRAIKEARPSVFRSRRWASSALGQSPCGSQREAPHR